LLELGVVGGLVVEGLLVRLVVEGLLEFEGLLKLLG